MPSASRGCSDAALTPWEVLFFPDRKHGDPRLRSQGAQAVSGEAQV